MKVLTTLSLLALFEGVSGAGIIHSVKAKKLLETLSGGKTVFLK
jgi:hypothetical protein